MCVILGLIASACSHHSGNSNDAGRLVVDGHAEVAAARGSFRVADHTTTLHLGDRVHLKDGTASIRLVPDGLLELRNDSRVRLEAMPFLETGDLLVEPAKHSLLIGTDQAQVSVPAGVTRISRTLGLAVKSYLSTSALQAAGRPVLAVRAPRQANVTDLDLLPKKALPISYQAADPWDQRYLSNAEELKEQLQNYTKAFGAQLAEGQGHTSGFYKLLFPQLDSQPGFNDAFAQVENRPVPSNHPEVRTQSNYLIAAAIALRGTEGTFADRWLSEFAFARDFGGAPDWGLIAYDQGVAGTPELADDVLAALRRAPLVFTLAPAERALAIGAPPGSTTTTTPGGSPTTITPPGTTPATPPTTSPRQGPLPVAPPTGVTALDKLVDPLVDPLIDRLNRVLAPILPPLSGKSSKKADVR